MPAEAFNLEAAKLEGLVPIRCSNKSCDKVLALMSADGSTLTLNNSAYTSGRVALHCECGGVKSWRPSYGPKRPGNGGNSRQA
jgi:hypothetical protein